jgi:hemoglobin/transferrin/lactoferrin receptor protein
MRTLFTSTVLASVALLSPAFAQSTPLTLPEVLTTATRTERNVLDALSSADILGAASFKQNGKQSLGSSLQALPNMGSQVGTRRAVEQLNIRGLDDRRITYQVDGTPRTFRGEYRGRTFMSPSLLKQIEVVRGAGSVVQGSGAIAGVVNVITKDATDYLTPGQTVGGATEVFGATNGALIGGNIAVAGRAQNIDALVFQEATTQQNVTLGGNTELPLSSLNSRQSFVKGNWYANDATTLTASFSDYYDRGDFTSNAVRTGLAAGFASDRRAHAQDTQVQVAHTPFNNPLMDLRARATHTTLKITEVVVQPGATKGRRDETRFNTDTIDVQNTSRFAAYGLSHAVTFGATGQTEDQRGIRPGTNRAELFPNAEKNTLGVFAQNEIARGNWEVVPGLRYEHYAFKGTTLNTQTDKGQATAKLAAGYRLNQATRLFGSIGQGFRSPLLTEAFSSGSLGQGRSLIANPNLKPERSLNTEAGANHVRTMGWQPSDTLTLRGAVFYNQLRDLIERQGLSATQFQFRNVGKAHTYGYELSAAYNSARWFGSAALGHTRGENETQNQPLLDTPPFKLNTTLGKATTTTLGTWRTGWTMEAALQQTRVPRNDVLVGVSKGYITHGVFTTLQPSAYKNVQFGLNVDNMFDKRYRRVTSFINETGLDIRANLKVSF